MPRSISFRKKRGFTGNQYVKHQSEPDHPPKAWPTAVSTKTIVPSSSKKKLKSYFNTEPNEFENASKNLNTVVSKRKDKA